MDNGIIYEQEVTVEVDVSIEKLIEILNKNGFKLKEEYKISDIYLVKENINIKNTDLLDLLKNVVLVRNIITYEKNIKQILYKHKEFATNGDIIKQGKVKCNVDSIGDALNILRHIGYKDLVIVNDSLSVYANSEDEIVIEKVDNHLYIEVESDCYYIDKTYKNIDELKSVFNKYGIPIKNNNFFVKKVLVALKEKYNI